jgi:hypothetical protein
MSGEHAKKEMETGEKPTTSHWKASSEESEREGEESLFPQVASEW